MYLYIYLYTTIQPKSGHSYSLIYIFYRMGFFGAAQGCGERGGDKKVPLPKICHAHPTMMKLGRVIPYLKKSQKIYELCDTPLELC